MEQKELCKSDLSLDYPLYFNVNEIYSAKELITEENKILDQSNIGTMIRAFYMMKNQDKLICTYFSKNNYLKLIFNH